jgi:hypothetical protein
VKAGRTIGGQLRGALGGAFGISGRKCPKKKGGSGNGQGSSTIRLHTPGVTEEKACIAHQSNVPVMYDVILSASPLPTPAWQQYRHGHGTHTSPARTGDAHPLAMRNAVKK